MATTAEQLASVQDAIAKIESGAQSYMLSGRRVDRGDLATLYAREATLQRKIQRAASGSFSLAQMRSRS